MFLLRTIESSPYPRNLNMPEFYILSIPQLLYQISYQTFTFPFYMATQKTLRIARNVMNEKEKNQQWTDLKIMIDVRI